MLAAQVLLSSGIGFLGFLRPPAAVPRGKHSWKDKVGWLIYSGQEGNWEKLAHYCILWGRINWSCLILLLRTLD
jgi:hypothetical protein